MTDTWGALADPRRRSLLDLLRQRPRSVNELVDELAMSQPAASKHLKALRTAGLVRVTPDAQRRIYELDPAGFDDLAGWLAPYQQLWSERLDALEAHLDRTPTKPAPNQKQKGTRR